MRVKLLGMESLRREVDVTSVELREAGKFKKRGYVAISSERRRRMIHKKLRHRGKSR